VLITGFDGKPTNRVITESEFKPFSPIIPIGTHPGTKAGQS
jgi:hypothetical protein